MVAGSSNFTRAGLATNLELNLGNYAPHTVKQVSEWFDELWEQASDYDLAALFESRFEPHPPQLIYLRMLWERYGAELDAEAESDPTGATEIHLTSFQTDGLWRAKRILAVRRTRSFVKQYYPNDTVPIDGREQIIAFPTPRVRKGATTSTRFCPVSSTKSPAPWIATPAPAIQSHWCRF